MIHYRDRTFCNAPCVHPTCDRRLTEAVYAAAERWWGKPGAPISRTNFAKTCPDFTPAEKPE